MARKKIQTQRLTLRAVMRRDLDAFAAVCQSDQVKKTYMLPDLDMDGIKKLHERMIAMSADTSRFVIAVCLEDRLIGWINDTEMDETSLELGWVLHPDYWGKGYATEAVAAALLQLEKEGFSFVYAGAFSQNAASIRVMQKVGMHLLDRSEEIDYRGQSHHCIYYGKEL